MKSFKTNLLNIIKISLLIFLLIPFTTLARDFNYRQTAPFEDINEDENRYYIEILYKLGLIDGYSDGTFRPETTITRGEFSKFIANVFQVPPAQQETQFPDIEPTNVFYGFILDLKSTGIVSGYSDGLFRPEEPVSKGEAAKIISIAASQQAALTTYPGVYCGFNGTSSPVFDEYICNLSNLRNTDFHKVLETNMLNEDYDATRSDISKWTFLTANYLQNDNPDLDFFKIGDQIFDLSTPQKVEEFDSRVETSSAVIIEWDEQSKQNVDVQINGYLLEKREKNYEWIEIDQLGGIDGTEHEVELEFSGTIEAGDVFEVKIDSSTYSYTVIGTETIADIVANFEDQLDISDLVRAQIDTNTSILIIESRIPGQQFTLKTSATNNGATDDQRIDENLVREGIKGEDIRDGVIFRNQVNKNLRASIFDYEVKSDTDYEYRIAAFKFIPYQVSNLTYQSQELLEQDTNNRENMIIGDWVYLELDTPES